MELSNTKRKSLGMQATQEDIKEIRRKCVITGIAKLNDEIKEENKIIKCQLIEKQQSYKPTFLERVGLKKQEQITDDLPPIKDVISNIDDMIQKAEAERHTLLGEKLDVLRTETANKARKKERTRKGEGEGTRSK